MHISYIVLLDKRILSQIVLITNFDCMFYIQSRHTPIKFLALLPGTNKSLVLLQNTY